MTGSNQGKRLRRSEREWGVLISRFERSGLSVGVFCRRELVSEASFYRWRNLLNGARTADAPPPRVPTPAFVDLGALTPASVHRPPLELKLDLGDGLILHLVRH